MFYVVELKIYRFLTYNTSLVINAQCVCKFFNLVLDKNMFYSKKVDLIFKIV